jgi:hypothetical protein
VLDEVAPADAMLRSIGQKPPHHIELVVAREDLLQSPLAGLRVLLDHHLGVVLQDVCQAPAREDSLPEVVGLKPVRVRRVTSAVLPA